MSRYQAIEGSQSGHCCFEGTVVDTREPSKMGPDLFRITCECFDFADAEMIAAALNAQNSAP